MIFSIRQTLNLELLLLALTQCARRSSCRSDGQKDLLVIGKQRETEREGGKERTLKGIRMENTKDRLMENGKTLMYIGKKLQKKKDV